MIRPKPGSGVDFQRYIEHKYHKSVISRINSARNDLNLMQQSKSNKNISPLRKIGLDGTFQSSAERTPVVDRTSEEGINLNTVTENVFKSINK